MSSLPRPCKLCGEKFNPATPGTMLCNDCWDRRRTIKRTPKRFRYLKQKSI